MDVLVVLVVLVGIGWLGLRITPGRFTDYPEASDIRYNVDIVDYIRARGL